MSDNTASDRLLREAGGPAAVAATLRELRIDGVDVSRYELEFAADYFADMLVRLVKGALLNRENTAWLMNAMTEMHARDTRLRAGLPSGTLVGLRPGTSGETDGVRAAHNASAVVTLPGATHLVIAAFLKGAKGTDADRDRVFASIAGIAYQRAVGR